MVVKICPRCSNRLYLDFPGEYPSCLQCGYEDYGSPDLSPPPRNGREGAKHYAKRGRPRHWWGSVSIFGYQHGVGLTYQLHEGEARVGSVEHWPPGEVDPKAAQIRKQFRKDTGYRLCGLAAWLRENAG